MNSKFYTAASFLILLSVLHLAFTQGEGDPSTSEICKRLGSVCSKKCDKILVCTEVNATALVEIECEEESYCQETEDGATCDATSPQCSSSSVNVICGSEGRFPHPTKSNAFVKCPEELKPPRDICYCPSNKVVNSNDATLPCTTGTAPEPADCDTIVFGGLGEKFSYFCRGSDEIIVFLKAGTSKKRSLINTRADVNCVPYSSGGSNTDPTTEPSEPTEASTEPSNPTETSTEPSEPTETSTEPSKPTETSTEPSKPTDPPTDPNKPTEPNTPVKCSRKGEYHADSTECHHYYFCKTASEPIRRSCPPGTYFHKSAKICLEGSCSN